MCLGLAYSHVFWLVWLWLCIDVCIDICTDMCIDMSVDMCIGMFIDMCIDIADGHGVCLCLLSFIADSAAYGVTACTDGVVHHQTRGSRLLPFFFDMFSSSQAADVEVLDPDVGAHDASSAGLADSPNTSTTAGFVAPPIGPIASEDRPTPIAIGQCGPIWWQVVGAVPRGGPHRTRAVCLRTAPHQAAARRRGGVETWRRSGGCGTRRTAMTTAACAHRFGARGRARGLGSMWRTAGSFVKYYPYTP